MNQQVRELQEQVSSELESAVDNAPVVQLGDAMTPPLPPGGLTAVRPPNEQAL